MVQFPDCSSEVTAQQPLPEALKLWQSCELHRVIAAEGDYDAFVIAKIPNQISFGPDFWAACVENFVGAEEITLRRLRR